LSGISGLLNVLAAAASTAASSAAQIVQGQNVSVTNFTGYAGTMSALNDFAASADSWLLPTGLVMPFAGTGTPSGWLLCDGSQVSRSTFAGLYTAFGANAFGTDTDSLFYLPDLRGRAIIGVGTASSGASLTGVRGVVQGASGTTLTNANIPEHSHDLQNHTHGGTTNGESNGHVHGFNDTYTTFSSAGPQLGTGTTYSRFNFAYAIESDTTAPNNVGHTHTFGTGGPSTNNSGPYGSASPTAVTAVQPSMAISYFVKT
jgi:microcystin-dependent protein